MRRSRLLAEIRRTSTGIVAFPPTPERLRQRIRRLADGLVAPSARALVIARAHVAQEDRPHETQLVAQGFFTSDSLLYGPSMKPARPRVGIRTM